MNTNLGQKVDYSNNNNDFFIVLIKYLLKKGMKDIKKLKEKILEVRTQLVMKGYLDGWSIKWYEKRLEILTQQLQEIEN